MATSLSSRIAGAALVLAVSLLIGQAPALRADPLTASRLHWITNGDVTAATVLGDTLYFGGSFTRVAPASAALGSAYALSTTTGAVVPGMPLVDGEVLDVEPDGAGGYYLAGRFTRVGGEARSNLAHVFANGGVDAAFAPRFVKPSGPTGDAGTIYSVAKGTSSLFVAGDFGLVNDVPRFNLAALDAATGGTLPWSPSLPLAVTRLLVGNGQLLALGYKPGLLLSTVVLDQSSAAVVRETLVGTLDGGSTQFDAVAVGSRLYVGGRFLRTDNVAAAALAAVDLTTGLVDSTWTPNFSTGAEVYALAVSGTTLFVGGQFSTFGGNARTNLAAVDIPAGVVTAWAPTPDGIVHALAPTPGGVLAAGDFLTMNGQPRDRLAEISPAGLTTAWASAAHPASARTLAPGAPGSLVVGGRMALNGGIARAGLAAFSLDGDALLPWVPAVPDPVVSLEALASRVFIGTQRFDAATQLAHRAVLAVAGDSGVPVSWPISAPGQGSNGLFLWGADGEYVYLGGTHPFVTPDVVRADPTTGAIDPGWQPAGYPLAIVGGRMYSTQGETIRAQDLSTGQVSTWQPSVSLHFPEGTSTASSIAIDGSTAYVTSRFQWCCGTIPRAFGFDLTSGRAVTTSGLPGAVIASADGQVVSRRSWDYYPAAPGGRALALSDATGLESPTWSAGLSDVVGSSRTVFSTPTDVIALGVEGVWPSPVNGVAVLPRTAPISPHGLTWRAVGNTVTFTWTPPGIPPSGYVLEAGSVSGAANLAVIPLGPTTSYATAAPNGTYFVRVRATGAAGPAATPSNEVAVVVGCTAPPAPPTNLTTQVAGGLVTLRWDAPPFDSPTGYVLEAGSASGASNIATLPLGPTNTSYVTPAPSGTYFVRTRAVNACGRSTPSPEVFLTVGAVDALPPAPGQPTATVAGQTVTLQWPGVPNATGYVMEVGSAPRLADLLRIPLAAPGLVAPGVPYGLYYVRVRAVTGAGLGPPSHELVVRVGVF